MKFVKKIGLFVGAMAISFSAMSEEITIGYQGVFNPYKKVIDEQLLEKQLDVTIKWRRFDSGAKAMTALASGSVDIATAGSSPIAAAVSNGVKAEVFWILENIGDAEALVVRDGSDIMKPSDLKGKTIGVPFVSTTHFHMMFALEQFGIKPSEVKLLNMQPSAISAAWRRNDIDAAFIWDPVLGQIKQSGHVLVTSKTLSSWGKPTFDALVANKKFADSNKQFLVDFVKIVAAVDKEYNDNKDSFTVDSPIAKSISKVTGGDINTVPGVMALYEYPTLEEQASCAWLGCGAKGGVVSALQATSEFLLDQKKISGLKEDYSVYVNPEFIEAAMK
ncbi:taurine ABC transporter substrate-binding protein [Marinomonas pollencensis]|uniref:Taurine transport system substrate-binding protein n=1 Tax=Marinomonas pollencensis TaxID=491954 RepID=A0A3E0DSW6_9GAMM|nr:taurine ABC transporter substrate-binding protein [Marinomonas pollencensis]REG86649.1 taurine transport system substrate-binding protein [Marinomonas pollencensis]